jgi:NitT/TauT family transport system ATP-binding protein
MGEERTVRGAGGVIVRAVDVGKVFVDERGSAREALAGVNLDVVAGQFLSIIGPSGCGKSTLLRILGGLSTPTTGEVDCSPSATGRTAFVFQDHSLFPWLRVVDNAAFGLRMLGVPRAERRARALAWLERLGLASFANAWPDELSGGMRQRLSLARALVTEPVLLLMDEPLGALDPQTRLVIQQDLARLFEQTGITMVMVTHSLEEALLLGDRVVAMTARPGRIAHVLEVALPRPRTEAVMDTSAFGELRHELWTHLEREVRATIGGTP